jgi:hypothetical protein
MAGFLPASAVPVEVLKDKLADLPTTLRTFLEPSVFGFSESMAYFGTEFSQAATVRFQVQGTRRVGMISSVDLYTYLIAAQG